MKKTKVLLLLVGLFYCYATTTEAAAIEKTASTKTETITKGKGMKMNKKKGMKMNKKKGMKMNKKKGIKMNKKKGIKMNKKKGIKMNKKKGIKMNKKKVMKMNKKKGIKMNKKKGIKMNKKKVMKMNKKKVMKMNKKKGMKMNKKKTAGTGTKVAETAGTGTKVAEAAGTGTKVAEAAGTGTKVAEAAGTGTKVAEAAGTGTKVAEAAGTGTKVAEASETKKKEDRPYLNMFVDLSSSLNSTVEKEIFKGSHFAEDYLNLEIEGKTNDKISYRFSKRLDNKNSENSKIVDLAYLKYKWNDNLHFLIGKQPIAFGSMEYANSFYDKAFRYTNVYKRNVDNPVGFNLIYHPIKNQELQLQIVNSNSNNTKEKEYDNKKWTHPMGGTLNWNCSFFNKIIQSRSSYSIFQENEKNNFWKLLAIGGKLDFKPISMEADYILSDEDVEKNGNVTKIIQSINLNYNHSPSIKYGTYLVKFKYNFLPKWYLIAKGVYETGISKKEFSDFFGKDKLFQRLYTYYGGIEYLPVKNNEDISLHLVYQNQRTNYNFNKIKKENKNNHFIILGFSYRVKII